jgi:hypothetical protein
MEFEKVVNCFSTINRALGIIEGVMLVSEMKEQQALATAVEMLDEVLKEVLKDGN